MTREVPVDYKVNRAANNPDTQRHQLNRILEDIREKLEGAGLSGDYVTQQELEAALANIPTGGRVDVVVGGVAITVNSSNPAAPVVDVDISDLVSTDSENTLSLGTDGALLLDPSDLISADTPNALSVGSDGKLVATGGGDNTGALSAAVINASGLQVGDGWQQFLPADVGPWTGWELVMSPAGGTVQVDILANGTPVTTGGSKPEITTGTSATGSTTGWAASGASAGDMLRVEVTVVTGTVEHVYLYLHP